MHLSRECDGRDAMGVLPHNMVIGFFEVSSNLKDSTGFVGAFRIFVKISLPSGLKTVYKPSVFERLHSVGAILNTSFNLHGDPIVCTPRDALQVFDNSGLRFMGIGSFLIKK